MTATTDQIAAVLTDAVQILRVDGWCQGRYRGDDGSSCATEAVWRAASRTGVLPVSPLADAALREVQEVIRAGAQGRHLRVATWNDEPSRTLDEVIAALTAAAERQVAS